MGMSASLSASGVTLYEDVNFVNGSAYQVEQFDLSYGTDVTVTLTDFGFKNNFDYLGIAVTSSTEEFLRLDLNGEGTSLGGANVMGGRTEPLLWSGSSLDSGVFRQTSVDTFLEQGSYYVALIASVSPGSILLEPSSLALYGIEVIATPIPGALWLFLSGLVFLFRNSLVARFRSASS